MSRRTFSDEELNLIGETGKHSGYSLGALAMLLALELHNERFRRTAAELNAAFHRNRCFELERKIRECQNVRQPLCEPTAAS